MNNSENNNPQAKILNDLKIGVDNDSNTNTSNNNNRFINNLENVNSTQLDFNDNEKPVQKDNVEPIKNSKPNDNGSNPLSEMNIEDAKLKSKVIETNENQYVNSENKYNETSLNDLNVEGTYNKFETPTTPFSNDEQVRENIEYHEKKTSKIVINQEMKIFIIIGIVMLIFIIIMPYIFDIVEKIRFH